MKLNKAFILHRTESETFLVPVGGSKFAGIVKGNATLGEILHLLEKEISKPELLSAMAERFDAPEGAIERDVEKALEELRTIGALDE